MLVLARQRDEQIIVGDDRTVVIQLTPLDELQLRRNSDPGLQDLARRLLIALGQSVAVTTVDIRGDEVRLGVDAPRDVPVHRYEVLARIRREGVRRSPVR